MRVPIGDLIDLNAIGSGGRGPSPKEIRDALPRGWVLDEDGLHARRDMRLAFREGWILVLGLVCFGAIVLGIFWSTFPRGWSGILRFVLLLALLVVIGGLVAPSITRALNRGPRPKGG